MEGDAGADATRSRIEAFNEHDPVGIDLERFDLEAVEGIGSSEWPHGLYGEVTYTDHGGTTRVRGHVVVVDEAGGDRFAMAFRFTPDQDGGDASGYDLSTTHRIEGGGSEVTLRVDGEVRATQRSGLSGSEEEAGEGEQRSRGLVRAARANLDLAEKDRKEAGRGRLTAWAESRKVRTRPFHTQDEVREALIALDEARDLAVFAERAARRARWVVEVLEEPHGRTTGDISAHAGYERLRTR